MLTNSANFFDDAVTHPCIECVPNFSEGCNIAVIRQIVEAIRSVPQVKVIHVDIGYSANRTVVTFVGSPEHVLEAAFRGVKTASKLINMHKHKGEHPRFGATDVLPLIPLQGVTMQQVVNWARQLSKRICDELNIPVYTYAEAAYIPERQDLAVCRKGEFEGLEQKMQTPEGKPDFMPSSPLHAAGACAVGARSFLIAYNININSTSSEGAKYIAQHIRESGYRQKQSDGTIVRIKGTLAGVKAIGWYIDDFKQAQVSINITNIEQTALHTVFEEVCTVAQKIGLRVTGSEIVGLVPIRCLLKAGQYFLEKQHAPYSNNTEELLHIATLSLGLNDVKEFQVNKQVLELAIKNHDTNTLPFSEN